MSDVRRRSPEALGRETDELERRVDEFLPRWRERRRNAPFDLREALDDALVPNDAPRPVGHRDGEPVPVARWFPAGEYEKALGRWEDLAEDWGDVSHADYCRRMDGASQVDALARRPGAGGRADRRR